jgi:hypothetical protein
MNKYRQRLHAKAAEKSPDDNDSGSVDRELTSAAGSVYSEAEEHRERVKARDAAAKARKKRGARRG